MSIEGMPERFGMGPGKLHITTADGTTVFEGLRKALMVEETHNDYSLEYKDMLIGNHHEFTCAVRMTDEGKAHLLGFRNANCMYRAVRRRKRWEEKKRRRRLKEGNKDA